MEVHYYVPFISKMNPVHRFEKVRSDAGLVSNKKRIINSKSSNTVGQKQKVSQLYGNIEVVSNKENIKKCKTKIK